jgi:beta-glucosidase-like glycosyl hydrolase
MLAKSLNDLCESDQTVANILRDRWGQTGEIISMSIPMLALMADMKEMNNKENNDE